MCATCGCDGEEHATIVDPREPQSHPEPHREHDHPHRHDHAHHDHDHDRGHGRVRELEARILAKNDALAQRNRGWFAGREILALNLLGAPGAGKTSLIERTLGELRSGPPVYVVEGDQATANDAERIRRAGAPAVQINTGTGCHLDADMVARGLAQLRPPPGAIVLIENVGNLVCPALFDLGEHAKVVLFSATEGEDKPVKYPHMFRAANLVILNKVDLLPYLDFDVGRAIEHLRAVNPKAPLLQVSARSGEGMPQWLDWLRRELAACRDAAFA